MGFGQPVKETIRPLNKRQASIVYQNKEKRMVNRSEESSDDDRDHSGPYFGWRISVYPLLSRNGSNQGFRTVKPERGEISSSVTATGTINPVITVLGEARFQEQLKHFTRISTPVSKGEMSLPRSIPRYFRLRLTRPRRM